MISSKLPKHSSDPIKYAFSVGNGIPRLVKNFGDFSDIGKLSFAGKKKLQEEGETQCEQQRRPQKISAGYEQFVSSADYIMYGIHDGRQNQPSADQLSNHSLIGVAQSIFVLSLAVTASEPASSTVAPRPRAVRMAKASRSRRL